jgi:hypothetical protein
MWIPLVENRSMSNLFKGNKASTDYQTLFVKDLLESFPIHTSNANGISNWKNSIEAQSNLITRQNSI